jgi:subtilisin family serine protease
VPTTLEISTTHDSRANHGLLPGLAALQDGNTGCADICIAVLDGPVDTSHPCFAGARLQLLDTLATGASGSGRASQHGTHVASIIFGQPGSPVTGLAPHCRGLILPIFADRAYLNFCYYFSFLIRESKSFLMGYRIACQLIGNDGLK